MGLSYPWQFESRRSAVLSTKGMVATSHPLAARTGASILEDGGTAADAAVATAAVLSVVEPHMTGIGGDMFALTQFDGEYAALNGSGGAPAGATIETYRDRTDTNVDGQAVVPTDGGLPVTVPGALDGWKRLIDRYGQYGLDPLLEPAIEYARDGTAIPEYISRQWQNAVERIKQFERTAETFLSNGEAPSPGNRFSNRTYARTLEKIGTDGTDVFYGGEIGEEIVETVREHDGTLALSDLEGYRSEWTDPIRTDYHGVEILEHPPNGQGAIALEAQNIAEQFDLPADPKDPDRLHHLIEAMKLSFADGYEHISDPAVVDVPLDTLVSKQYAAKRASDIGRRAASYDAKAGTTGDTVYLAAVDTDGNAVSFINSIYKPFGSGLTVGGFALQNRGHSFSLDRDHTNALQPGKRPFHTIIPALLCEEGEFRATWGVMGGAMQPQGHLQVACNLIDSGLNPQAALDAPRFRWLGKNHIALESSRLPDAVVADLEGRGHRIIPEDDFFEIQGGHWGGGQMVYRDEDDVLIGGSDPRRDGQAVGL